MGQIFPCECKTLSKIYSKGFLWNAARVWRLFWCVHNNVLKVLRYNWSFIEVKSLHFHISLSVLSYIFVYFFVMAIPILSVLLSSSNSVTYKGGMFRIIVQCKLVEFWQNCFIKQLFYKKKIKQLVTNILLCLTLGLSSSCGFLRIRYPCMALLCSACCTVSRKNSVWL